MSEDDSGRKGARKVSAALRGAAYASELPANLLGRGRPITEAAKMRLVEVGIKGEATILKAPMKARVDQVRENVGRFTVTVALPDKEPYEAKVWQAFWVGEWERMRPGSTADCLVDPDDPQKVFLLPRGGEEDPIKVTGATINVRGLFKKRT